MQAYSDEGYVDLLHLKDLSVLEGEACEQALPEQTRLAVHRATQGACRPRAIRLAYGSHLAENRAAHFLAPPEVGMTIH